MIINSITRRSKHLVQRVRLYVYLCRLIFERLLSKSCFQNTAFETIVYRPQYSNYLYEYIEFGILNINSFKRFNGNFLKALLDRFVRKSLDRVETAVLNFCVLAPKRFRRAPK